LVRIEGRAKGFQDLVFLKQAWRVAEEKWAGVLIRWVYTPPAFEGKLEIITVDYVGIFSRFTEQYFSDVPYYRNLSVGN